MTKSKFRKGLERISASGIILVGGLVGGTNAEDPGYLKIKNHLNSYFEYFNVYRNDSLYPGAKDGIDTFDRQPIPMPPGHPNCYSDIGTHKLWSDFRAEDSNAPYDSKFSFNGILTENKENWLEFSYFWNDGGDREFGNKPIIFQSDRLPYGSVVDIKRAMAHAPAPNEVEIPLIDVPSGTYNQWSPYGSGQLDIGSRLLADLNDNGFVDNRDYNTLANDYGKSGSGLVGDISGPNGIPDGVVNNHDIRAFGDDYLKSL